MVGWAPCGCAPDKKLQKSEAQEVNKNIQELLDRHLHDAVSATPLCWLNHCLAYRVDGGRTSTASPISWRRSPQTRALPSRRQWQLFYWKVDYLRAHLVENKWAKCERSTSIYSLPTFELVGQVNSGIHGGFGVGLRADAESWAWTTTACCRRRGAQNATQAPRALPIRSVTSRCTAVDHGRHHGGEFKDGRRCMLRRGTAGTGSTRHGHGKCTKRDHGTSRRRSTHPSWTTSKTLAAGRFGWPRR